MASSRIDRIGSKNKRTVQIRIVPKNILCVLNKIKTESSRYVSSSQLGLIRISSTRFGLTLFIISSVRLDTIHHRLGSSRHDSSSASNRLDTIHRRLGSVRFENLGYLQTSRTKTRTNFWTEHRTKLQTKPYKEPCQVGPNQIGLQTEPAGPGWAESGRSEPSRAGLRRTVSSRLCSILFNPLGSFLILFGPTPILFSTFSPSIRSNSILFYFVRFFSGPMRSYSLQYNTNNSYLILLDNI